MVNDCANRGVGCQNVLRDPATNQIVTVNSGYVNLSNVFTRGWDIDGKY